VISRKSEGLLFRYAPEDKDGGEQSHYSSLGVSGLLGSQGGALIPVGNRRMARREEHEAESNGHDSLSLRERAGVRAVEESVGQNSNGHHNGNGHSKNGHAKLNGNGHSNGNGHANGNGNGKPYGALPIIDRLS
jgi:hypothetical protein